MLTLFIKTDTIFDNDFTWRVIQVASLRFIRIWQCNDFKHILRQLYKEYEIPILNFHSVVRDWLKSGNQYHVNWICTVDLFGFHHLLECAELQELSIGTIFIALGSKMMKWFDVEWIAFFQNQLDTCFPNQIWIKHEFNTVIHFLNSSNTFPLDFNYGKRVYRFHFYLIYVFANLTCLMIQVNSLKSYSKRIL